MKCRRCGAEIDTRRKRPDGSVQCPKCKTIYRPRSTPSKATPASKRAAKPSSGVIARLKAIPWKRRYWKMPLWVWACIGFFLVLGIIGSFGENTAQNDPAQIQADSVEGASASQTPLPDTSEWEARFLATEPDLIEYINDNLSSYSISSMSVDYFPYEPDYYSVMFKAVLTDSTEFGIKSAIAEISRITPKYFIGYGITFLDQNGYGICIAVWDSKDGKASNIKIKRSEQQLLEYASPEEMPE